MSKNELLQAWKNKVSRRAASNATRQPLPENPAGLVELTDAELDGDLGANGCPHVRTIHLSCWDPDCGFVSPTAPDYSRGSNLKG
ncbi:MAG: mersacidin/lichenicidin family type 2 lantibiotic [Pirellulaceae bacterium]|nr:mersacidin/lichenicidin family type 2 lantibiotic [Pirellulaceae bacterium]